MNYGSEPADQIVRFSLEGTEVALKLSGLAAKNFALFVYAVLKDQKKTHGKTRLVRMIKEQRPLKFFTVPADRMQEFAMEANKRGLLFVPIRNKKNPGEIELAVFADDAAKVNRVMDRMNLDYVKAQSGDAVVAEDKEKDKDKAETPNLPSLTKTETVKTGQGTVEFSVGGFEDDFSVAPVGVSANFTQGREKDSEEPLTEKSPSVPSSPSKSSSPAPSDAGKPLDQKPSVKKQLHEIKQEQAQKAQRAKEERARPAPQRSRHKKKTKGR